jgi:hypothetical protein
MKKFIIVGDTLINVDNIICLTKYDAYGKLYIKDMEAMELNLNFTRQLIKQLAEMEWIDGIKEH